MREHGLGEKEILADLELRQSREPSVHGARLFGLVYPTGRSDLEALMEEVNRRYLFGNALNPFKFTELAALEREVIEGVGALLHIADGGGGAMTSGGTESILMSMLVSRERARRAGSSDRRSSHRLRPTPPTRRPRTTSAWTSCACRSTPTCAPMCAPPAN